MDEIAGYVRDDVVEEKGMLSVMMSSC